MNTSTAFTNIKKPHVSINVSSVHASVEFYRNLFAVEPKKFFVEQTTMHSVLLDDQGINSSRARTGYAKFDLEQPSLNLVLNETKFGKGEGALSHMGVQLQSNIDVQQARARIVAAGLKVRDELQVNCCYARQDKFWVADPDGNEWEVFTVIEDVLPTKQSSNSCAVSSCLTEI